MINAVFVAGFEPSTVGLGETALRMMIAVVLGAMLGVERESQGKPAGLRTHILVALGAALFLILGVEILSDLSQDYDRSRIDPSRVLEGVIGGIGFLGAGNIIRHGGNVEGLTTAASIWLAGAVGAGCGLGKYLLSAMAVGFSMFVLVALRGVASRIGYSETTGSSERSLKKSSTEEPTSER